MVKGYVPLAEMFGYSTDLRSKTQGRGNYSMFFEKYEQVLRMFRKKYWRQREVIQRKCLKNLAIFNIIKDS